METINEITVFDWVMLTIVFSIMVAACVFVRNIMRAAIKDIKAKQSEMKSYEDGYDDGIYRD